MRLRPSLSEVVTSEPTASPRSDSSVICTWFDRLPLAPSATPMFGQ